MMKASLSVSLRLPEMQRKKQQCIFTFWTPFRFFRTNRLVFIRTQDASGCLVSFVENDGVVGDDQHSSSRDH